MHSSDPYHNGSSIRQSGDGHWPDMAALIDDPADLLAEELGCTRGLALRVLVKMKAATAEVEQGEREQLTTDLMKIVAELLQPGNVLVRIWALLYATGRTDVLVKAPRSQDEMADSLGVTRADMSHFVRRWKVTLNLKDTTFSRTDEAVENSRKARIRTLNGNGGKKKFSLLEGGK